MPDNERRLALEEKLRSSPHPPRANARFDAENDHNPLMLQDCPECGGTGKRDIRSESARGGSIWTYGECSACRGTGITGDVEHYFLTDAPEVTVIPDSKGWLRCPGCGIAFTIRDPYRWTGYRHLRCGQRIRTENKDY